MMYLFRLSKEQAISIIESLESIRREDENETIHNARHSLKQQYKEQFEEDREIDESEVINATHHMMGVNYCESCD
jgi:hypothetical protein